MHEVRCERRSSLHPEREDRQPVLCSGHALDDQTRGAGFPALVRGRGETHYESALRSSAARFSQTLRTGSKVLGYVELVSTVSPKLI
jgi:hypothetical protein